MHNLDSSEIAQKMNYSNDSRTSSSDTSFHWFLWYIFVWLFPLLCLVGAVANACSFIVIVSRRKSFPYVTRQYLVIIIVSDFITLTFCASIHYLWSVAVTVQSSHLSWLMNQKDLGLGWCAVYFLDTYALVGAQFFQLGLTVDRLVAVAAPMKAKIILSHKRSWIMLVVISAMALLVPVMLVSNFKWDSEVNYCIMQSPYFHESVYLRVELYGRVILMSALMLGTIAMCVLLAWRNKSAQRMQQAEGLVRTQQQRISRQRRRSLVRMSFILIFLNALFAVTSLPYSIVGLLVSHVGSNDRTLLFTLMGFFSSTEYLGSALSWPVYFMGRNFRQAFFQTFYRRGSGGSGGMQAVELRLRAARP